jgi:hypothetical protein
VTIVAVIPMRCIAGESSAHALEPAANVRDFSVARSTGPILAVGGITILNRSLLAEKQQDIDFRVIVGTAIAAGGLALLERLSPELAIGVAWIALLTVLFARLDPVAGAPAENIIRILGVKK